jgi:hypothetical protein
MYETNELNFLMNKQSVSTSAFRSLTKQDLHIHTPYCNHAACEMEEFVQAGIGC